MNAPEEEFAPGPGPSDIYWRDLFIEKAGWHDSTRNAFPKWLLWSLDGVLGATFVLGLWAFADGLARSFAQGWW